MQLRTHPGVVVGHVEGTSKPHRMPSETLKTVP
jgi:hypothetical protein